MSDNAAIVIAGMSGLLLGMGIFLFNVQRQTVEEVAPEPPRHGDIAQANDLRLWEIIGYPSHRNYQNAEFWSSSGLDRLIDTETGVVCYRTGYTGEPALSCVQVPELKTKE